MSPRNKFMRPLGASLVLVAAMGISAAHAADVISEEPPAPAPIELPVASWMGPYVGAQIGYGFAGRSEDSLTGFTLDTEGFVGGGFAGYNFDTGNGFIIGVEGDIGYSGVKESDFGVEVESGLEGSLRARLGYTVTPDVLLYATAGGAAKRMSVSEGGIEDSNTATGWTAGVGTDIKLTNQVFGRVEYRYTDYGSDTYVTGSGASEFDARDHRVLFGVGVHF